MKYLSFVIGTSPGNKPFTTTNTINDSAFEKCEVHCIIVNDVTNNTTFIHDPLKGDIQAGNVAGFPLDAKVGVWFTPNQNCN
jgi:hypothetical protein